MRSFSWSFWRRESRDFLAATLFIKRCCCLRLLTESSQVDEEDPGEDAVVGDNGCLGGEDGVDGGGVTDTHLRFAEGSPSLASLLDGGGVRTPILVHKSRPSISLLSFSTGTSGKQEFNHRRSVVSKLLICSGSSIGRTEPTSKKGSNVEPEEHNSQSAHQGSRELTRKLRSTMKNFK